MRIAAVILALGFVASPSTLAQTAVPATDAAITEARVRDPNASFLDVAARRADLAGATGERVKAVIKALKPCPPQPYPAPPKGRMIVPPYYLEGSHGPVNPAHAEAARPFTWFDRALTTAATRYVATGDAGEAACALKLMAEWADAGALLDYTRKESSQAWYTVEWVAAASGLALSVLRNEPSLERGQVQAVAKWLIAIARHQLAQLSPNPSATDTSARNNHAYWRGLMAASIGVAAGDDALFRLGVGTFRDAVSHLDENGAWPLEMARHERAMHYQSFGLQPLILIAELAWRQGIDLYALKINGRSIHDAVRFLLRALDDPAVVAPYAQEPQYLNSLKPGSGDFAWGQFYARRFPGSGVEKFLDGPLFNSWLGGSAAVYAAPAR